VKVDDFSTRLSSGDIGVANNGELRFVEDFERQQLFTACMAVINPLTYDG